MDYEAIDRDMSSYVVTCVKNQTRFYITDDSLPTDILGRAKRYRWHDLAEDAAEQQNADPNWQGFTWSALSVPEAMVKKVPEVENAAPWDGTHDKGGRMLTAQDLGIDYAKWHGFEE